MTEELKPRYNQAQYNLLLSFLWNIANDVLVQAFEKGEYKKVTLPFIVLRRLDLLLEDTKEAVLNFCNTDIYEMMPDESKEQQLCTLTKLPFYNTSPFTMKTLRAETDQTRLRQNFMAYLDGFSIHVQDIITKFDLRHYIEKLSKVGRLGMMIEKMTDEKINLGIKPVIDAETKEEKLPALDNHTMGTLFEDLLRRFNEDFSVTEAGEHYTPRDYVQLLAELAIEPVADKLPNGSYDIYDGACGTGGILSIAQDRVDEIVKSKGKRLKTYLYGQELQPETFATCKADLMLSGHNQDFTYRHGGVTRVRFVNGSTISENGHPGKSFDFCISNPPFGTPWKADLERWGISKKEDIVDKRFYATMGDEYLTFVPNIGDPQMLFLANNVSRMKEDTEMGTRIVEIHNGSSLFTGNAGGGESNLRRYIIENDMLEAIIAMPENMFYNTGIGTFIWIVINRKEERRRGKVQLIDATSIKTPLRKNLGNKNCEASFENRKEILQLLERFEENEKSKIFDNREFGFWQISVERPLRLKVVYDRDKLIEGIKEIKLKDAVKDAIINKLDNCSTTLNCMDWNEWALALLSEKGVTMASINKIRPIITETCPEAVEVRADVKDRTSTEYEIDKNLSDTEQVPLLYEGGIDAFMRNEVLPYAPDAFVNENSTVIGYELSFTKYFYKPVELRSIEEISAEIRGYESMTDGLLNEILAD